MKVFDKIKKGLEEAVDYEKGNVDAKSTVISANVTDSYDVKK